MISSHKGQTFDVCEDDDSAEENEERLCGGDEHR